jgi:hypothetical protein
VGDGHVGPGVIVRGAVLRLVLHGERVDRHAGGLVGLHELQQVQGVGTEDGRVVLEPAADDGVVRLHPGRLTPRGGHHLDSGIELQGPAQQRQDLRLVVRDAEPRHRQVCLAAGQVVVGVVRLVDEVRSADGLAEEAHPDAVGRVEDRREYLVSLRGW